MPKQKLVTKNQGTMAYDAEEPFYILNPRNAYAGAALRGLINVLNNAGGEQGQLAAIDVQNALQDMEAWQANNHTEVGPPEPQNKGSLNLDPDDFADVLADGDEE